MGGDLTEVEICDLCGNEVEEYSIIEGLVICDDCKEDFVFKVEEDNTSEVCAICGWPINKPMSRKESMMFVDGIKSWIRKNGILTKSLREKLDRLFNRKIHLCRYDFFYLILELIRNENEEMAEKFEKEIASKYDFKGGIIS